MPSSGPSINDIDFCVDTKWHIPAPATHETCHLLTEEKSKQIFSVEKKISDMKLSDMNLVRKANNQ